ncbi:MGH1-like glycoside hydrolase domain-containing protein [Porphyromonas pogonae]|uniref:MGH1-like glycoside hydrolase domain-containing protein n=2 Tax=Pseudomonadati TaxID=3379134 RepID=UPI002E798F1B|nr:trehalase family glycosidase [Porphyromonas pogonae]
MLLGVSEICTAQETKATKYNLPYKNTYVKEPLVTDNVYRTLPAHKTPVPSFAQAKNILPEPIWDGYPDELAMYWKAWEFAVRNLKHPLQGSGFVSTYFDTAYNGNIFMWDSCFILMFARYGTRLFPFQQTLDNFYAKQHPDGFICREIKADGADCFERYDPVSTGPNLLPWCEMVYYKQFGDTERLHKVFPVLCAYYKWLKLNRTWRNGTYWSSGWGTGMDNMPRVSPEYNMIFSHGHMIWLDTNLQQLFIANLLLEMGLYLERWQEIEDFEDDAKLLKNYISTNLWDEKSGFLYDQYADGKLNYTKGIGAYWALYSDVLDSAKLDRLTAELDNPNTFNRKYRVPSLSADNPKYRDNGRYWQGGIWPGTNYMVINGLYNKGYKKQALEIARNHYSQVLDVYRRTHTFWEYYAPEKAEPGFMARKDFIGWTGLPPISILIEYMLGIKGDYINNTITWDLNETVRHGIKRYPFGPTGSIDLIASARTSAASKPQLSIKTNKAFKLVVNYGDRTETIAVTPDRTNY